MVLMRLDMGWVLSSNVVLNFWIASESASGLVHTDGSSILLRFDPSKN